MKTESTSQVRDDFFLKNEREQNLNVMRIMYFTPIAAIFMLIGLFLGIFREQFFRTYMLAVAATCIQSALMKLFCSINPAHPAIKYYVVLSTEILVFLVTITKGFSAFILYAVPPLISCIYFNKGFCLASSLVAYIGMILSIVIRAMNPNPQNEDMGALEWGLAYGIGLTFEYIMNVWFLRLLSIRHVDVIKSNLDSIETIQKTQDELIASYSELIYRTHRSSNTNIKRCQQVVRLLCDLLKGHKAYSELSDDENVNAIVAAVPLHDIGLIGVPDSIVSKKTALTPEEREQYQQHVVYGEEIIRKNFYLAENREFLKIARDAALYHHERWDGYGYPEKIPGVFIPLCARIIAVADALEERLSGTAENPSSSLEAALSQIQKQGGHSLDPVIVEALLSARMSLEQIFNESDLPSLN